MTLDDLQRLFEKEQCRELAWEGKCHDCKEHTTVVVSVSDEGEVTVDGGAVYKPSGMRPLIKCPACFDKDKTLRNYQPCEVYSRVVGYLRPVGQWNTGKQEEFRHRSTFDKAL